MIGSRFASAGCIIAGFYYAGFGAILFFWPHGFWSRIAPIGPYNEHYARDIGSFLLPLGVALLLAASDPVRYRGVIALAAAGSLFHATSHFLDAIRSQRDVVSDASLTAVAILLVAIVPLRRVGRE